MRDGHRIGTQIGHLGHGIGNGAAAAAWLTLYPPFTVP
jgi:hypothetical protein